MRRVTQYTARAECLTLSIATAVCGPRSPADSLPDKKRTPIGSVFFFCERAVKRCVKWGKNEQKVSEITASIPALSAVAIWEMCPLFLYNDMNCHKAFFHCDKFRHDLL